MVTVLPAATESLGRLNRAAVIQWATFPAWAAPVANQGRTHRGSCDHRSLTADHDAGRRVPKPPYGFFAGRRAGLFSGNLASRLAPVSRDLGSIATRPVGRPPSPQFFENPPEIRADGAWGQRENWHRSGANYPLFRNFGPAYAQQTVGFDQAQVPESCHAPATKKR